MHLMVLAFSVCIAKALGGYLEGVSCIKDGQHGVCTDINKCQSFYRTIAMKRPPMICSIRASAFVVCCFDGHPSAALTTTTSTLVRSAMNSIKFSRITKRNRSEKLLLPSATSSIDAAGSDGCAPLPAKDTARPTGRGAWDKCIEYQRRYVYPCKKKVVFTGGKIRVKNCGHVADRLIVGGENANAGEFPHMALLGYGSSADSARWLCGGSVLSERFVLTAAHCTRTGYGGLRVAYVQTGTLLRSQRDAGRVYAVAGAVQHPAYAPPGRYHDIALLHTATDMLLDRYVVPACLPVGAYDDSRASAIGFGLLRYMGSSADRLQKVILKKFSDSKCTEMYPPERLLERGFDQATQMCYGDMNTFKDTCQGDSGGPLQILNEHVKCMYTVVGVISFGRACGFVGEPGIYTRVSAYTPWIESIIWPN